MKTIHTSKTNIFTLLIISSLILLNLSAFSQETNLSLDLKYGKYSVGFKSVNQYDRSRTYYPEKDEFGNLIKGEGFRPIQTLIWYPANIDEESKSMVYEDYVYNYTYIENLIPITDSIKDSIKVKIKKNLRATEDIFLKALTLKTETYKNADSIKGSFPIIIYAPSWSNLAWENLTLCSYLASHGYIVVASPSFNENSREMSRDIESLDAQAKDIEFLVDYIKNFPNTDSSKIAFLGYSWGGTSNIIAAERLDYIDALISLDGAIQFLYNRFSQETSYLDPLKMKIPFLAMCLKLPTEEVLLSRGYDFSFDFFESLKYSDAYKITFSKMAHHFFRGSSQRFAKTDTEKEKNSLRERNYCYKIMCQYTLNFFNITLKDDKQSEKKLNMKPEEQDDFNQVISVEYKAALK